MSGTKLLLCQPRRVEENKQPKQRTMAALILLRMSRRLVVAAQVALLLTFSLAYVSAMSQTPSTICIQLSIQDAIFLGGVIFLATTRVLILTRYEL